MRGIAVTAAVFLAISVPAFAQSSGNGWGGALDQLNRAVNPDNYPQERDQPSRDQGRGGRRYEGTSDEDRSGSGPYRRYSDRDLRDQYDRLLDEQRQVQRNRRSMEDELERRGLRR